MAAETAANPIPSADLRSILFIAFLPRLRNEPPQKRRAHFRGEWWCETEKRVGFLRERACRWHQCWSFAPNGDFGTSPLQGQLHSTRPDAPEKQLVSPEDPIGIRPEVAIAAPRNAGCTKRTWRDVRPESAFGGKAEVGLRGRQGSFWTHLG